ncbi:MAG: glycosyltransferase [Candidatus Shapirobacteria bacterium]
MNKKLSVMVAIPAWNEEKTIIDLLRSVKFQKQTQYRLDSVWVYSDGSTDQTVSLVKKNFPEVKIVDGKRNLGKNAGVNQIMKGNKSDILIQIDADITIKNKKTFDYLLAPFIKDDKVGLVCAYHLANTPSTFIGELSYFGFRVWDRARNSLGRRGIRYYCEGGLRAFSKEFAKNFRLPTNKYIGEDSYSFYYAVKNGFKVAVSKRARAYLDLADNYQDYVKQMKRFLLDPKDMPKAFGKNLTDRFETMTLRARLKALISELAKSPWSGLFYLVLQAATKMAALFYKSQNSWVPIKRK